MPPTHPGAQRKNPSWRSRLAVALVVLMLIGIDVFLGIPSTSLYRWGLLVVEAGLAVMLGALLWKRRSR